MTKVALHRRLWAALAARARRLAPNLAPIRPDMPIRTLHLWLLVRLVAAWVVISLVTGGLIAALGNHRLERRVVELVEAEAARYAGGMQRYLDEPTPAHGEALQVQAQALIVQGSFLVLEFYDGTGRNIAEATTPGFEAVERRLPSHRRPTGAESGAHGLALLRLDGELYVRVFIPLRSAASGKYGNLEGIYHVPAPFVREQKDHTLLGLAAVVFSVFVTAAVLYPLILQMYGRLMAYSMDLARANLGMLEVLGSAIAKRDSDTNGHNHRVTLYSVRIGERMGLGPEAMRGLIKGAFLHDVGKIGVPDAILLKPGRLTPDEFEIMKRHVDYGMDIIAPYPWLADGAEVVRSHHERFDGTGYGEGLLGKAIPLNARIFAVADVFDALCSRRPYKDPLPLEASLEIIRAASGTHFDPQVVAAFLGIVRQTYERVAVAGEADLRLELQAHIGFT